MKKQTDVGGKGVRTSQMPLTAVVLAMAILLMTVGDVVSAQTAPVAFARGGAAPHSQQAITIPSKPGLRSPYQPPAVMHGPPPWAAGGWKWVPGRPWTSSGTNGTTLSKFKTSLLKVLKK
ncbi:MAG: hypothetical protein ACM3VT_02655 [Solirubrobacterales bacterium]